MPVRKWGERGVCRGPLIVMCHWLGGGAQTWTMLAERLAERGLRCAAVDLPGFGSAADVQGYSVREMADAGMEVVENGTIKVSPDSAKRSYLRWLQGINDWCISRQLWYEVLVDVARA